MNLDSENNYEYVILDIMKIDYFNIMQVKFYHDTSGTKKYNMTTYLNIPK